MACDTITKGRKIPCKDAIGGIKDIYFYNYDETTVVTDVDDKVTDIQLKGTPATGGTYYHYRLKGNQNNLTENANSSYDTGTTYFEQLLSITLPRLSPEMSDQFKRMAHSNPYVVIVDYNDNAYMIGTVRGAELTGGTVVSGAAKGDLSGYTATFMAEEKTPANWLDGAVEGDPFAGLTATQIDGGDMVETN